MLMVFVLLEEWLLLWHTAVKGLTVLQLSQEPDRKSRKKLCTYM